MDWNWWHADGTLEYCRNRPESHARFYFMGFTHDRIIHGTLSNHFLFIRRGITWPICLVVSLSHLRFVGTAMTAKREKKKKEDNKRGKAEDVKGYWPCQLLCLFCTLLEAKEGSWKAAGRPYHHLQTPPRKCMRKDDIKRWTFERHKSLPLSCIYSLSVSLSQHFGSS